MERGHGAGGVLRTVRRLAGACAVVALVGGCGSDSGNAGGSGSTLVRLDVTGDKTARLRGDAIRCVLDLGKMGPSFYYVSPHAYPSLGPKGFVTLGSSSTGIPGVVGAFEAHPASVGLRIGNEELSGGGNRGGRFEFSKDLRHVTVDVALHRSGKGSPLSARLRGTITCADRTTKTSP